MKNISNDLEPFKFTASSVKFRQVSRGESFDISCQTNDPAAQVELLYKDKDVSVLKRGNRWSQNGQVFR